MFRVVTASRSQNELLLFPTPYENAAQIYSKIFFSRDTDFIYILHTNVENSAGSCTDRKILQRFNNSAGYRQAHYKK